ncbi:MAG: di-heme oxidoredictase family protein [Rhizobiaceae bacterium]
MDRKLEFGLAAATIALFTGVGALVASDGFSGIKLTKSATAVSAKIDNEDEGYRPLQQAFLNELARRSGDIAAFEAAFEAGDELTEISFTAAQGIGAKVGEGRRFSRMPRPDLAGKGDWATHLPKREGGPNATSCIACHNSPGPNGAGDVALNAVVDPGHTGDPKLFLERNTLPLLALGVPQRLAEEMSAELADQKYLIFKQACDAGTSSGSLAAKGVDFGQIRVARKTEQPCEVTVDWSGLEGIDRDLIVKPFGWKGNQPTIRAFTRNAAHNELGLQGVELVADADGDHDGVANELTVGDMTALTIYMAALERPVTKLELAELGLIGVSSEEREAILQGEQTFQAIGCATCHVPEMELKNTVFSEPSKTPGYFDVVFPSGEQPSTHNLTAETAIKFDLAADQPNNQIEQPNGKMVHLGALKKTGNSENGSVGGETIAQWYSDFKRHDMGKELADPADPLKIGASMWLTRSLAGVGSTGPWLHDGRATTLNEAIMAHGGEAFASRNTYSDLDQAERASLITFLESLVIYKQAEAE